MALISSNIKIVDVPNTTFALNKDLVVNAYTTKPAGIYNSAQAVPVTSQVYKPASLVTFKPASSVPDTSTLKVTGVSGLAAGQLLNTPPSSNVWRTVGEVATNALNLGASVLLAKYTTQPTKNNITSPENTAAAVNQTPGAIVVYDPSKTAGENISGIGSILDNIIGTFINRKYSANGDIQTASPNINGYLLIAGLVLIFFLLLRRR